MISAIQVNDMFMGALDSAMNSIAQQRERRADIEAMQYDQQLVAWKDYAGELEHENHKLRTHIDVISKNYEHIENKLKETRTDYALYVSQLISRIKKLDDALKRQSANTHAINKMRERLVSMLEDVADPQNKTLLEPDAQLEMMRSDWQHFMETNEVPPTHIPREPEFNLAKPARL